MHVSYFKCNRCHKEFSDDMPGVTLAFADDFAKGELRWMCRRPDLMHQNPARKPPYTEPEDGLPIVPPLRRYPGAENVELCSDCASYILQEIKKGVPDESGTRGLTMEYENTCDEFDDLLDLYENEEGSVGVLEEDEADSEENLDKVMVDYLNSEDAEIFDELERAASSYPNDQNNDNNKEERNTKAVVIEEQSADIPNKNKEKLKRLISEEPRYKHENGKTYPFPESVTKNPAPYAFGLFCRNYSIPRIVGILNTYDGWRSKITEDLLIATFEDYIPENEKQMDEIISSMNIHKDVNKVASELKLIDLEVENAVTYYGSRRHTLNTVLRKYDTSVAKKAATIVVSDEKTYIKVGTLLTLGIASSDVAKLLDINVKHISTHNSRWKEKNCPKGNFDL